MNIDFNDLEKLISIAERANIDSLEVVDGNTRISIVCQAPTNYNHNQSNPTNHAQSSLQNTKDDPTYQYETDSKPASNTSNTTAQNNDTPSSNASNDSASSDNNQTQNHQITAPMLGTFYRRSDPSADVFVSVGDSVAVGDTLCVIEAMKIMHEVKANNAGTVEKILVDDGDVVEFDQALLTISIS